MADYVFGIRTLLLNAGVISASATVQTADWSLFFEGLPKSPHRAIHVREIGGLINNPKWLLDYVSFQLLVRGENGERNDVRQKCIDCRDTLLGIDAQDINGDRWCGITAIGNIGYMGTDETDRPRYFWNFQLIVEPATNALTNRQPL